MWDLQTLRYRNPICILTAAPKPCVRKRRYNVRKLTYGPPHPHRGNAMRCGLPNRNLARRAQGTGPNGVSTFGRRPNACEFPFVAQFRILPNRPTVIRP